MKKIIVFLLLFLLPLNVVAYSEYIVPGGKTLGIEVDNDGIIIIGFYKVNNQFNRRDLKVGDTILKVNNENVFTINDLINKIETNVKDDSVILTVKRNNKIFNVNFNLIKVEGVYKTGLFVKDKVTGIGTLTYIDPQTRIYGALGHEIIENESGILIEVKTGKIFRSIITSIERSSNGVAGTKNAKFYSGTVYGTVIKNTNKGIYGIYTENVDKMATLKVGQKKDLKLGNASILTVLNGEEVKKYNININKIDINSNTKNIHFTIISDELITKAGGVVQGMSGSPMIQDDFIIGAVTHVIVDNPATGYGIFITTMLEEGEKEL